MRPYLITLACLCSVLAFVAAVPVPASNQELDVLQIPLSNGKELDVLTLGGQDQEIADRNKRTIGLLRDLFPDLTKEIDGIVNRIIAQVIRVAGPDVLRSVLGNRSTTPRSSLDADFDDDDEDDEDVGADNTIENDRKSSTTEANNNNNNSGNGDDSRVQIDLPTFSPESTEKSNVSSTTLVTRSSSPPANPATTTAITSSPTSPSTTTITDTPTTITTTTTETPTTTSTTTTSSPIYIVPQRGSKENPTTTTNIPETTTSLTTAPAEPSQPFLNRNPQISDLILTNPIYAVPNASVVDSLAAPLQNEPNSSNGATDTQIDLSAINKQLEETIRVARQVKEAEAAAAAAATFQNGDQQQQQPLQLPIPSPKVEETIQLSFNNELTSNDRPKTISNELQLSESKSPAIDELSLDSNEDTADLDDRNKSNIFKRFLQFGGAGLAGGASSGSSSGSGGAGGAGGAGSGNFLFDIVRLFSGSIQNQGGDEAANSVNSVSSSSVSDSEGDSQRGNDGYTEGIPGPVTRLVVLANRGLANLVQDLILRVAATSEKFVNFKAKLITALI